MKIYKDQEIERTSFYENNIETLLADPNSEVAKNYYLPEKVKNESNDIKICKSVTSVRFLKYVDGKPVSMIQVAPKSDITKLEKNLINLAYTLPEYRNKGFANELLNTVKKTFKNNLVVANMLTEEGERLFKPESKKPQKRSRLKPF